MSETISMLLNLRTLRAQSRELTLEQLQEGLEKLTQVVNERVQEEEQLRAENRENEEKLETYRQLLLADGIDPEELIASSQHLKQRNPLARHVQQNTVTPMRTAKRKPGRVRVALRSS